jgi:hypothetical protein
MTPYWRRLASGVECSASPAWRQGDCGRQSDTALRGRHNRQAECRPSADVQSTTDDQVRPVSPKMDGKKIRAFSGSVNAVASKDPSPRLAKRPVDLREKNALEPRERSSQSPFTMFNNCQLRNWKLRCRRRYLWTEGRRVSSPGKRGLWRSHKALSSPGTNSLSTPFLYEAPQS